MTVATRQRLANSGWIVGSAAAVVLLRFLTLELGIELPLITVVLAVVVPALFGGISVGLVATALCVPVAMVVFLEPIGTLGIDRTEDRIWLILFVAVGILISIVSELRQRALGRAEQGLQELQTIIASIGDAVVTTDRRGLVTRINAVAADLTGWTEAEAIGQPLASIVRLVEDGSGRPIPNPVVRVLQTHQTVISPVGTMLVSRTGVPTAIEDHAAPIRCPDGDVVGVVVSFRDVGPRRTVEQALRRSEERFRSLAAATAQVVWTTDAAGLISEDSASWRAFTGQTSEQFLGDGWRDAVHPDDRERTIQIWTEAVASRSLYVAQYRLRHRGGGYRWTIARGVPLLDHEGTVREWVGMNSDVTDEQATRAALEASETRYRLLTEVAPQIIWATDPFGNVTYTNQTWSEFSGLTGAHSAGRGWLAGVEPSAQPEVAATWRRVMAARTRFEAEIPLLRRQDGTVRWHLVQGLPIRGDVSPVPTTPGFPWPEKAGSEKTGSEIDSAAAPDLFCGQSPSTSRNNGVVGTSAAAGVPAHADDAISGWLIVAVDIDDRKRAEDGLRDHARLSALRIDVSRLLTTGGDQRAILQGAATAITTRLGVTCVRVWTVDPAADRLVLEASAGGTVHFLGRHETIDLAAEPPNKIARIARAHTPLITNDALHDVSPEDRPWIEKSGVVAIAGYPLMVARRLEGVMAIYHRSPLSTTILSDLGPLADDISQFLSRKRWEHDLRESESRFRTLADNISPFAWMADPAGNIVWYNRRWYDYTGTTFAQMRDWGWEAVHHPDHLARVVEHWRSCLESGQAWEDQFPLRGRNGTFRWFLSRALPIRDEAGRVIRWFGTNTDVTDQRAAELALREADRRKDEFLATLAHELRNPLAPIRTGLEAIKTAAADPDAFEHVRATMERQTQQLMALVDDLLEVSRITSGKLRLRVSRLALADVVQAAVETTRSQFVSVGHDLTVVLPEQPIELIADAHRLTQVLSNLLGNAAKYTPPGGTIRLTAERSDDTVVIKVTDNGRGIPPEMLERIFELFTQIDRSVEQVHSGLGIGLTLVQKLVELHGGTVTADSTGDGQGATFTVRLPWKPLLPAPTPEKPVEEAIASRRRVLIVDDNRAAADLLAVVVRTFGHEARVAYDGEQSLMVAEQFRPEIVLMDLGMPKMNGYDATREMRRQTWGRETTIVALTGWGQEEHKRLTVEAGFDRHLTKPIEPPLLRELIATAMPSGKDRSVT